jgi:hypothetical protein
MSQVYIQLYSVLVQSLQTDTRHPSSICPRIGVHLQVLEGSDRRIATIYKIECFIGTKLRSV